MKTKQQAKGWLMIAAVYALVVFGALVGMQLWLGSHLAPRNIVAYVVLSVVVASIVSLGGYMRQVIYLTIAGLGSAVGLANAFYVVLFYKHSGFADITSLIGFMLFAFGGIILGALVQMFYRAVKASKNRQPK